MDAYLELAQKVLSVARRPMSAKSILNAAYSARIVPDHLYGRTQHKTLQARLSEDILHRRASSLFFRTEPGMFFLTELISDTDIPLEFKEVFPARRRTRDLQSYNILGVRQGFWSKFEGCKNGRDFQEMFREAERANSLKYLLKHERSDFVPIWTFSIVKRKNEILTYRIGRYRDDRDAFANKQTIGFPNALTISDRSLFSQEDYGAKHNALSVLLIDLDLSYRSFPDADISPVKFLGFLEVKDGQRSENSNAIILVFEWGCPDWFEPLSRRLSLNNPRWVSSKIPPNNIDDFEPWSKAVFDKLIHVEP